MLLSELLAGLDRLIPFRFAESWDRAGLHIGDPGRTIERVQIALDLTARSLAAARAHRADLILCHHPPIFNPLEGLRLDRPLERLVYEAVQANLAVAALHTNLDAVPGGVADQFARRIGLRDVMTFVPIHEGDISSPSSPWAEAFPLVPGFGRTGTLPQSLELPELAGVLRTLLGSPHVMIVAADHRPVQRITVCPGSFEGDWAPLLKQQGSDALITGEIKYHDRLLLTEAGVTVAIVGHDVSERVVLGPLAALLADAWPELAFAVDPGFDYNEMAF